MKIITDISVVVFRDGLSRTEVLAAGEYDAEETEPLDNKDDEITWFQINCSKPVIAFNRKKPPKGIIFID